MAATITKKPNKAVTKLGAPARQSGNHKMKATWKVPSELKKSDNKRRATGLEIDWYLGIPGKDPKSVKTTGNESLTHSTINLNNLKIGKKTYTRDSFYPCVVKGKTSPKLYNVSVKVIPKNGKGKGPAATAQRPFEPPRKPYISWPEFDAERGVVKSTITTNAGEDHKERYDTWYTVTVQNTRTGETWKNTDRASTSTSFDAEYNASDYQQLSYNEYIKVTFNAYARGYAGNSEAADTRTFYVSYPAQTTINGVDVSSKDMSGKCTVRINTNNKAEHPVDRVKLEYLADCEYAKEEQIPAGASWTVTDIIDDASCTALAVPVADVLPSAGKYTWVRVKSYHADETVLYRYSKPMRVTDLETPAKTAADDYITILSAGATGSGDSAFVDLAWNEDGEDDSTGTELTWSDEEDTWKSTETPSTFTFSWSDGRIYKKTEDQAIVPDKTYYTRSQTEPYVYTPVAEPVVAELGTYYEVEYYDSARVIIKGLAESTQYYVKARRYLEGETTTYSPYSNPATVIASQKPESVVASADRYVSDGESLSVRWTFSGYSLQKSWQIVQNTWYELTDDTTVTEGRTYYSYNSQTQKYTEVTPQGSENPSQQGWYVMLGGTVIASGDNSIGTVQISSDRIKEFAVSNSLTYTVQVSTGSGYIVSEEHTVTVIEKPTLSIDVDSQLTAQPLSFEATASTPCDLKIVVSSQGAMGQFPNGILMQANGDTIYSDTVEPVWGEYELTEDQAVVDGKTYYTRSGSGTEDDPYVYAVVANPVTADIANYYEFTPSDTVTVTLPAGLSFWDLCKYTVQVTAIDKDSNLQSDMASAEFTVAWAWQAADPSNAVTLTVIDTTDEDGDHRQAVSIALSPPDGSYRLTLDTSLADGKTYYERSGEGTEESPYVFEEVTPEVGDNPASEGWYELSDDVYDIYRMDVENPSLIGQSFPLSYTAVDEYAPFGHDQELSYRVAIRTADGDTEFADISYTAECENLRFDWADGFLELPYGISFGDSYRKSVEIRQHMNGENSGYWAKNIERKSNLESDVIRIIQPNDIEKARLLGRYAGPVFVRKPDGSAFEADVQVTDLSRKNEAVMHVAFDGTEVALTDEFALPIPFNFEDAE